MTGGARDPSITSIALPALAQLRKGKRLTRRDYEKQFTVSIGTAKRDLASLGSQIAFVGAREVRRYQIRP